MEISLKGTVLLIAIFITGLSAGLFYAWVVSVIPGLKRLPDKGYLETMQVINRSILNPGFFIIFFGALFMMIWSSYLQFKINIDLSFWLILGGTVVYLAGTIGVTIFGNVPMNESLDLVQLPTLNPEELERLRTDYEGQWNRFNLIRSIFSLVSFLLLLAAR